MKQLLSKRLLTPAVALGSTLVLVGLAQAASSSHARTRALVALRKTALGTILVDARGRTLYLFEKDRNGASMCNSAHIFVGDTRSGQTRGEGLDDFGAEWYALAGNGHKVERSASGSSSSAAPSPGYGASGSGW